MLWADKHRPTNLSRFDYHQGLCKRLSTLGRSGSLPHMIFYGPSGSGKKARVMALLREMFGSTVFRTKLEQLQFLTPSRKKVHITACGSTVHTELNPGDVGKTYDKIVVSEVIKEMAQTRSLGTNMFDTKDSGAAEDGGAVGKPTRPNFKVLILTEVDNLSMLAQQALRRTMEKYSQHCRIILCCKSLCKVIEAIRSRCLAVRVAAPTNPEICRVLAKICKKERLTLPDAFASRVAQFSNGNLRKAILMLEACKVQSYPFTDDQTVEIADWEKFIKSMTTSIVQEQTPRRLANIRGKLYELLVNCIPPALILKTLSRELMFKVDPDLKPQIAKWAAFYEHRMVHGSKPIFHLEAFCAKCMCIYKTFLLQFSGF